MFIKGDRNDGTFFEKENVTNLVSINLLLITSECFSQEYRKAGT